MLEKEIICNIIILKGKFKEVVYMYDFETLVSRRNLGSVKWEEANKNNKGNEEIIPFSVADMEFKNAPEIIEGLKEYAEKAIYGYTSATEEYYNAVCSWMKKRHDYDIDKEWIVETAGVVPALHTIVKALTDKNDGIMIMTPVYYPFYGAIENHNRKIVKNKLIYKDGKYTIDFDDFEKKAATDHVKMLILCNPHNPVGRVWTKDELKRIGDICLKNNMIVVSDEIHFDLIMPGNNHTVFSTVSKEFEQNSIICTAPSKTFNLAGLQDSNIIIANEKLRKKVTDELEKSGFFTLNTFAFKACELAYTKCEKWLDELIVVLDENRRCVQKFFEENLPQVTVIPLEGTYLQWLDFRKIEKNHISLQKFMENEAEFYLDEGYLFGEEGKGFERINLACPKHVLEKALQKLLDALNKKSII